MEPIKNYNLLSHLRLMRQKEKIVLLESTKHGHLKENGTMVGLPVTIKEGAFGQN